MRPIRTAPNLLRFAWSALFVFLLALRLLSPAGFMPLLANGELTIVACPDGAIEAPPPTSMRHHQYDHQHNAKHHEQCPYAASSSLGALGVDFGQLLPAILLLAAAIVLGRSFLFLERHTNRLRPPLRGPPLPT